LQLQADAQTTVTMRCLAGLHVLDKRKIKASGKMKKNLKKRQKYKKKRKKRFFTSMV